MAGCDAVYESDEEIKRILEEKDAQNTKKPTKTAIRTIQSFIKDLETAEKSLENLDKSLARFFCQCKKKGRQQIQSQCFANIKERS